eukprot:Pgem_evm2s10256
MGSIFKAFGLTTATLLTTDVMSHGTLKVPWGSQKRNDPMKTEFCNDIAPGMRQNYGHHPNTDMVAFARDFGRSQYKGDLRNLYKAKNINQNEYNQRTNFQSQEAPRKVKWQNHNADHFIVDHHGPCAVYVVKGSVSKRIFHHDNCVEKYRRSDIEAQHLPEECGSDCLMEFYWIVTGVNSNIPTGQAQYYYSAARLRGIDDPSYSGTNNYDGDKAVNNNNNDYNKDYNKDCTKYMDDPFRFRSEKQCCPGLHKENKDWDNNNIWYYKCIGIPIRESPKKTPKNTLITTVTRTVTTTVYVQATGAVGELTIKSGSTFYFMVEKQFCSNYNINHNHKS